LHLALPDFPSREIDKDVLYYIVFLKLGTDSQQNCMALAINKQDRPTTPIPKLGCKATASPLPS
jgi:hypothetical protein